MFSACRHIKSNGTRCQSPAMRRCDFCYFHAKLHESTRGPARRKLKFSPIEDTTGLKTAVIQTLNALLSKGIDAKETGLILNGIRIIAQKVDDFRSSPRDTVHYVSRSEQGDELAPELCVNELGYGKLVEDCSDCPHRDTCRHLNAREKKNPGTRSIEANATNGIAKTLTAASAESNSSQPPGQRRVTTVKGINAANFNQVIDQMSPITLLKTYLKLDPTGSPDS